MSATGRPGLCKFAQAWGEWSFERARMRIYDAADQIQVFDERRIQPLWTPVANWVLEMNQINIDLLLGFMSLAEPFIPKGPVTRLKELKAATDFSFQPTNLDPDVGTEGEEVGSLLAVGSNN